MGSHPLILSQLAWSGFVGTLGAMEVDGSVFEAEDGVEVGRLGSHHDRRQELLHHRHHRHQRRHRHLHW